MDNYCYCAKPIVLAGARGIGERCAKCLKWYDKNHWQSDPRVGLSYKLEAEAHSLSDDIIRIGREIQRREDALALDREARKLGNKIKRWIRSMFGRN